MAQLLKIESEAQIKSSPSKFYEFYKNNMCQLINIFPGKFECAQLVEGTDGCVGNVKLFKLLIGGRKVTMKARLEALNDDERTIIYDAFEGDHTKLYKSFKCMLNFRNDSVKLVFEFEKANESVRNPDIYVTFANEIVKALDAYLLNN